MNDRALLTLGVLLAAASRGSPAQQLSGLNSKLRELQSRDPMTAALGTVLAGATAFYLAERGRNPKVTSYYDALVYSSTNISVGYSDILARTPLGKLVGSWLMTYGPAMAARSMDPPSTAASSESQSVEPLRQIAAALEKIVKELDARRPAPP